MPFLALLGQIMTNIFKEGLAFYEINCTLGVQ